MKQTVLVFALIILLLPVSAIAQDSSYSEERLKEIQKLHSVQLSEEQLKVVQDSCQQQKTKLLAIQKQNDSAVRKRLVLYSGIQKELKAIEIRIFRQGADASELDLLIGGLDRQIEAFRGSAQKHSDLVTDLNAIDCKANPELYVAGIEELRVVRADLLEEAKVLKQSVIEAPNTTFTPLIKRLLI